MRIPAVAGAEVPERKLVGYLLAPDHHAGHGKAAFFAAFGYTRENWRECADALKAHAVNHDVASVLSRDAGTLYVVEGELTTPDGRNPRVRSVWCLDEGATVPRFITAYPHAR